MKMVSLNAEVTENMEPILKVAYFFLSVERPISETDIKKIDELGSTVEGYDGIRKSLFNECEKVLSQSFDDTDRFDVIMEGILKTGNASFAGLPKEAEQKRCLWILVNLALYDGVYSETEKKLIRSLMRKWEIDKSILIEMEDSAETLIEVDKHRSWIKTTNYPYDYVDSVVKEMDKNQHELANNISLLMSIG
jgi:hypothetical protein